jgi:photosystem II stability/assembly factor-like uncharacterized protein
MHSRRHLLSLMVAMTPLLMCAGPAHAAARAAGEHAAPAHRPAATAHEHAAAPHARGALDPTDPLLLRGLEWRSIGPYRGGRVTAVTGVDGNRGTYYFGGTGGGIWKSVDGGSSWKNVADGQIGTGSVGAITAAASDPNVVYAGMGEACIRGNVSHGDGVYRSTDAGRTWKHVGLGDSRQIGAIVVHPHDPDLVYVAALGHTFGPNHERGVFRSRDGGATWKNVLFVNDSTGAVDIVMAPGNPRILYATFWQVERTPWSLLSGGRGSALYKSVDGGDSWTRITGPGLPAGIWGRVGVTVSAANPDRVWAIVEADQGGVFRSDDAGRTWAKTNDERTLRQRAWYYTHIYADPKSADVVYVLNVQFFRSKDGGKSFERIGVPHGDNHDLWIDPDDPRRMIESNDGGVFVSLDGGASWTDNDNQATAQFYHVIADDQFPYHLYGAQQDNSTVEIASRTRDAGIGTRDWHDVGGCESGFIAPKPGNPDIAYAGCYDGYIGRHDNRTGEERDVSVYPDNPMGYGAEGMKYRFQWTFPIVASRHDPNTLYAGGNILFRSTNEGQSWEAISPDLTRNDPSKLGPSGGPITKDNTSVEYYCTIFAMAESRLEKDVLWTGSDDGLVHVTRDGGKHWANVTPKDLPAWSMISQIDASPHHAGTAYVAANRYKLDDYRPYAYVTNDYGKSWRRITNGLPENAFVRVVREDPVREDLLFCGTETGAYYSLDGGGRWWPLRLNAPGAGDAIRTAATRAVALARPDDAAKTAAEEPRGLLPVVPVTDLIVKDNDIAVSTQGRSFWILDDIAPLRQLGPAVAADDAHLFAPSPAYLFGGPPGGPGQNPPSGAFVYYTLKREPKEKEEITLEFLDASGKLIRKISSKADENAGGPGAGAPGGEGGDEGPRVPPPPRAPARAGLNRFAWNLREPDATRFKGLIMWGGGVTGPEVVPGHYQVRITAFGTTQTQGFDVRKDPRVAATAADYQKKHDFLAQIRDRLTDAHDAIVRIRDVRDQAKSAAERAGASDPDSSIARAARKLSEKLTAVEEALYQTKNKSGQDPLNYPIRLNNKLAALAGTVDGVNAPPTDQAYEVYRDLNGRTEAELSQLKEILATDLVAFNQLVRDKQVPAVVVKEKKAAK